MRLFSLAFLSGILLLQHFTFLPDQTWIFISIASIVFLFLFKKLRLISCVILGFVWCLIYIYTHTTFKLNDKLEGKNLKITGFVYSIPFFNDHRTQFIFSLKSLSQDNIAIPAHGLIKLSTQGNALFHVGEEWRIQVRLKKIHGMMNPGGFDYEGWALQEGIRANGYIVQNTLPVLLSHHAYQYPLNRLREYLKIKLDTYLIKTNTSPWVYALTIGERQGIPAKNWEVLRNTGTNHLMAIAGLHLGFVASLVYIITVKTWKRIPKLTLYRPAQEIGMFAAVLATILYSALAGFSIPTQRASFMMIHFSVCVLMRKKIVPWFSFSIGLVGVLIINPLSTLTESFWLSFCAVAFIIYSMGGKLHSLHFLSKWIKIQWAIFLGLIPFTLWLFGQCSIVSILANAIAIPWIGLVIVPLCLLGTGLLVFIPFIGSLILGFADKNLECMWKILNFFSHLHVHSFFITIPNVWILIATSISMALFLLPRGFPGRFLGVIWLLPLLTYKTPLPKEGEFWLTVLDVGQGLSATIQTQKHILIFDTGGKTNSSDLGESVITPFLRTQHVRIIDTVIVSHGDNDHFGGFMSLNQNFKINSIKTSVPERVGFQSTLCLRGDKWNWDGVNFQFIYPSQERLGLNNDSSCVLKVSAGDHTVLLTGDIEKYAENYLYKLDHELLKANIIIAPHHGSKTSAENDFLNAVHPQYVIFPIGYRNRYHFPHARVIEKYFQLKAIQMDTAHSGAILFKINKDKMLIPDFFRISHHHFWNS